MKNYLLTFCEDYADEHNVPALNIMNEEEYNAWREAEAGLLNPNFDELKKAYRANEKRSTDFWKLLKDEGIENTSLIPEDRQDLKDLEKEYRYNYKYLHHPKKVNSYIHAYLGNSGEGFEDQFSDFYLNQELIDAKIVEVFEVSDEFVKIFNEAKLDRLSLCNVFTEKGI